MKSVSVKLLALLCAVILVCSLAACGNSGNTTDANTGSNTDANTATTAAAADTAADPIVGSWEYESGGYTYNFNADGTGTYDVGSTVMNFTYELKGSVLSLLYEGNTDPLELEYEISGDTLNVKDSFGSDTIYKRK